MKNLACSCPGSSSGRTRRERTSRAIIRDGRAGRAIIQNSKSDRLPDVEPGTGEDRIGATGDGGELERGRGAFRGDQLQTKAIRRIESVGASHVFLQIGKPVAVGVVARMEVGKILAVGKHQPLPSVRNAVAIEILAEREIDPGFLGGPAEPRVIARHLDGVVARLADAHAQLEGNSGLKSGRLVEIRGDARVNRDGDVVIGSGLLGGREARADRDAGGGFKNHLDLLARERVAQLVAHHAEDEMVRRGWEGSGAKNDQASQGQDSERSFAVVHRVWHAR